MAMKLHCHILAVVKFKQNTRFSIITPKRIHFVNASRKAKLSLKNNHRLGVIDIFTHWTKNLQVIINVRSW